MLFTQPPEGGALRIVLRYGGVGDQPLLKGDFQQPLHLGLGAPRRPGRDLDQHIPIRRRVQRFAGVGNVLEHQLHAQTFHQLKGLDPAAGLRLGAGQQFDGRRSRFQGDHGDRA